MNSSEIRELDAQGLEAKLAEKREELFKLRFQHATGQLENTQSMKVIKKTIARLLTVKQEKASAKAGDN